MPITKVILRHQAAPERGHKKRAEPKPRPEMLDFSLDLTECNPADQ
jgi:hypothetical protein